MNGDTPLRVAIVDDEPLARDAVRLALARMANIEVVAECGDGESAVRSIRERAPDVVLLDIRMPGMDGFEVIDRVGSSEMPAVVFVTAYDQHAIRAFDVHALDYVLKPFEDGRLAEAIDAARQRLALEDEGERVRALTALLASRGSPPEGNTEYARRIMVTTNDDRIRFVRVDEVSHLESDANYVVVHTGGSFRIRITLKALLDRLDPRRFVRIHRSTVVNVDHIREVQPWYGSDHVAILRDGTQLKVSRRYRTGLLRTTL